MKLIMCILVGYLLYCLLIELLYIFLVNKVKLFYGDEKYFGINDLIEILGELKIESPKEFKTGFYIARKIKSYENTLIYLKNDGNVIVISLRYHLNKLKRSVDNNE